MCLPRSRTDPPLRYSDHFTILTQSGLVLWSKSFTPTPSPFDSLIREALIEERSSSSTAGPVSSWHKDGHALLWTFQNELELVFVVAYQRILQLTYVEELLTTVRRSFVGAFEDEVRAIVDSAKGKDVAVGGLCGPQGWSGMFEGWDATFSRTLRELELAAKVSLAEGRVAERRSDGVRAGRRADHVVRRGPQNKKLPRTRAIVAEAEEEDIASEATSEATSGSRVPRS